MSSSIHLTCVLWLYMSSSGILPQFFDRSHWIQVTALAKVMAAVQAACVSVVMIAGNMCKCNCHGNW